MKTKQEIERLADNYIDNMESHNFWDSFISGYFACQKDYESELKNIAVDFAKYHTTLFHCNFIEWSKYTHQQLFEKFINEQNK